MQAQLLQWVHLGFRHPQSAPGMAPSSWNGFDDDLEGCPEPSLFHHHGQGFGQPPKTLPFTLHPYSIFIFFNLACWPAGFDWVRGAECLEECRLLQLMNFSCAAVLRATLPSKIERFQKVHTPCDHFRILETPLPGHHGLGQQPTPARARAHHHHQL